ncbi:UNVERIFIED_CONTAM: PRD domain-containing protein [Escherichia coli]
METRLNLLCEAGVIDKDICKGMMQVVNVLETECHLPVRSEQGTMAMTHMASALMRSRRGEEIEPLDNELLAELAQSSHWQAVVQLHQVLLKEFALEVNPCEEGYLLAMRIPLYSITDWHRSPISDSHPFDQPGT